PAGTGLTLPFACSDRAAILHLAALSPVWRRSGADQPSKRNRRGPREACAPVPFTGCADDPRIARGSIVGIRVRSDHHLLGNRVGAAANRSFQPVANFRIILQELFGIVAALPDPDAVIAEPAAGFLDDAGLHAQIQDFADLGDAFAIHAVELHLFE